MNPYLHLPHLRGRIRSAEQCALRLTPEGLALWDLRAREIGHKPDWRLSDEAREADRRALLGQRDASRDLWVYAYGSLMWDPGIHFAEVRLAEVAGHQRRFTLQLKLGRGSPERPGLVLALEPRAGCCTGLAFRLPAQYVEEETAFLWRREMLRGGYRPLLLPMRTPQGDIQALAFTANHAHAEHAPERTITETAAVIAQAHGVLGSNRDYLEQLAAQLAALGIEDPYVSELLRHLPAQT